MRLFRLQRVMSLFLIAAASVAKSCVAHLLRLLRPLRLGINIISLCGVTTKTTTHITKQQLRKTRKTQNKHQPYKGTQPKQDEVARPYVSNQCTKQYSEKRLSVNMKCVQCNYSLSPVCQTRRREIKRNRPKSTVDTFFAFGRHLMKSNKCKNEV